MSPSGFYAWQQRPESPHTVRDRQLRVLIRASHEGSRRAYGSPRVLEDLLEQGIAISRKRVARLMQVEGRKARVRKRFRSTTMTDHDQPIAGNVLDRQFTAAAAESELGRRHHRVRHRRQREALSRRHHGPALALHRRVGPQRR